ncbi:phytanoyl-CoA dioxygenase family protein [Martelella soudanensis]|uniref:phytanoyl-CoA dioxygenase n=1 Tax=unclassified Martelella TaxID=2629616 RepID=UPI0015DDB810|nr:MULTISPECIES: phytanoyl-CoA dioxygenase [unclassified Martelella]
MSEDHDTGLSAAQVTSFIEDGYVRLDRAFDTALAAQCRAALWQATGLSPDAPETWNEPVIRIGSMASPAFVEAANTPRLHLSYDQLAGKGRWLAPRGIGTFPIRFPSPQPAGDDGWHVDVSFGLENPDFLEWRVNVKSTGRLLLMLFLFSDVGERDAPTIIRAGSHAVIARQLLPHGEAGLSLRTLSADGYASTAACPEVEATGPAGTVYLCHPFLVHRAQPHRGTTPRFMAQPPLLPVGEFDPALPPSPVQIAIRRACGLSF